nr:hypothetical protein [Alphaproteobacteria bacterium]
MTAFQTPSLADTRVVDPVLSTVAQGYQSPTNVGSLLFPEVMVDARGGKVLEFGKEAFNVYNAVRAPGSATKRIEWGYKSTEYALKQEALEVKIPRERMQEAAIGVPNIDLASASIRMTMRSLQLGLELEQQHLVVDGGIPEILLAANGTDLWGHSSTPQNNPIEVVYEARETIRK